MRWPVLGSKHCEWAVARFVMPAIHNEKSLAHQGKPLPIRDSFRILLATHLAMSLHDLFKMRGL